MKLSPLLMHLAQAYRFDYAASFHNFFVDNIYPDIARKNSLPPGVFLEITETERLIFYQCSLYKKGRLLLSSRPCYRLEERVFRVCSRFFLREQWQQANFCLEPLNYEILELELANETVYGMVPAREFGQIESENDFGFGTMRPSENVSRNLATSASHPLFDGKVGHIMASLFDHGTRTFSVTGTHRCFSEEFSNCSGKTSVCGQSEPFRMSDASHVAESFFQYYNEEVHEMWRDTKTRVFDGEHDFIHLQQHGMARRDGSDGFISNAVVNGASSGYLPKFEGGSANKMAEFMTEKVIQHGKENGFNPAYSYLIRSCNSEQDKDFAALCAGTNTLGRFINRDRDQTDFDTAHALSCQRYGDEEIIKSKNQFIHFELTDLWRSNVDFMTRSFKEFFPSA
ncbi:Oidioi.mRNA.OKI2018_I69.XSR.g15647.t1.cds [Oikopleura dioica]|uniref:Oidioi.mRNA.OKI2018_I69.XSR.g15647.t1.cds n=1 Tax=Oikopleura dioica TaxID=34765 RepID=A0ABN7SDH0_OIKDI|nr:Oidioi.mRNA.OKI2018_I69.XSR.g15647.t1.cds [Oikopleura dioica]